MHTFNGTQTYIHYNSDLSGEVHIIDKKTGTEIRIPGQDILDFVAEYVRMEFISRLENAETDELLAIRSWAWQGLPKGHPGK